MKFTRLRPISMPKPAVVLFACVHNAGRSQMANAWFNALSDATKAYSISAGTQPGLHVHAEVQAVLKEHGIDLADVKPVLLTPELAKKANLLITMGCGEACPFIPGLEKLDWPLMDPKGQELGAVRDICATIKQYVQDLIKEQSWGTV